MSHLQSKPVEVRRFEVVAPNFFFIPLRRLTIESGPITNRTYFIDGDRVVAVGLLKEPAQGSTASHPHSQAT